MQRSATPEPDFDMVTGISTGALLAPLIFLHRYQEAKDNYTTISDGDIYRPRTNWN